MKDPFVKCWRTTPTKANRLGFALTLMIPIGVCFLNSKKSVLTASKN